MKTINQEQIVNLINNWPAILKESLKGPGTARGIMIVAGLIYVVIFHPEKLKEMSEMIPLVFIYGMTDILRKK